MHELTEKQLKRRENRLRAKEEKLRKEEEARQQALILKQKTDEKFTGSFAGKKGKRAWRSTDRLCDRAGRKSDRTRL